MVDFRGGFKATGGWQDKGPFEKGITTQNPRRDLHRGLLPKCGKRKKLNL